MPYRDPPMGVFVCARCRGEFRRRTDKGRVPKFCSRTCSGKQYSGAAGTANPRYSGGLCFHRGRWIICCRDGTTLYYARGVMAAKIGRLLTPDEIVHHRNGRTDDDRPENLEITTRAAHMNMHRADIQRGRDGC